MGRTNVRATGLVFRGSKILLIHRFNHGDEYWTVLGGGVEDGETVDAAIQREMKEETGTDLISFKPAFDFIQPDSSQKLCHFFLCDIGKATPRLGAGPEAVHNSPENSYSLEWVDVSTLHSLVLYPAAAREIQEYYAQVS